MNSDILKQILENHKKWLRDEPYGEFADLRRADLRGANLRRADISCADLRGANLRRADISCADLRGADLRGADLRGADLQRASLEFADLRGANLLGANLERAETYGIKTDKKTKTDWPMACPETGSFIGWKKAFEYDSRMKRCAMIVKLEIPEDAERSSATTNKCRASWAKVLEIQYLDGTKTDVTEAKSMHGGSYKAGKMVYPDDWDYNRWNECSHGIHFFMTREEAVEW